MRSYKPEAYEQALAYRQRGFTYAEIAKICNVSKGTVSNWLRHEAFSQSVAERNKLHAIVQNKKRLTLINKARIAERRHQTTVTLHQAAVEYRNYCQSPRFIAGLTLYYALGDQENSRLIRLSSSRADVQQRFIRFLIDYLGVEKASIRLWLLLYTEHDEVACMKHWCKKTGLSPAQFHKNQVVKGRSQGHTLHFGVLNTIIGSTLLKQKLNHWLRLLGKDTVK